MLAPAQQPTNRDSYSYSHSYSGFLIPLRGVANVEGDLELGGYIRETTEPASESESGLSSLSGFSRHE